jgi:hypothetical protein
MMPRRVRRALRTGVCSNAANRTAEIEREWWVYWWVGYQPQGTKHFETKEKFG